MAIAGAGGAPSLGERAAGWKAYETELSVKCGRTRYMMKFVITRRTYGPGTDTSLLYLIAGPVPVGGAGRSKAWRLFDNLVNVDSVRPACNPDGSLSFTIRAVPKLEWLKAVRAGAANSVDLKSYTMRVTAEGDVTLEEPQHRLRSAK